MKKLITVILWTFVLIGNVFASNDWNDSCNYNNFVNSTYYNKMLITNNIDWVGFSYTDNDKWWNWDNKMSNVYITIKNNLKDNINKYPLKDISNWYIKLETDADIVDSDNNVNIQKKDWYYILTPKININNIIFNWESKKIYIQLKWKDVGIKNISFKWLRFNINYCADWIKDYGETSIDGWWPICGILNMPIPKIVKNNDWLDFKISISSLTVNWLEYDFYLKNNTKNKFSLRRNLFDNDSIILSTNNNTEVTRSIWTTYEKLTENTYSIDIPNRFKWETINVWKTLEIWWAYLKFKANGCNYIPDTNTNNNNNNITKLKLPSYVHIDWNTGKIILDYSKLHKELR